MLQIVNLAKAYGSQLLFDEVSFSVNAGERIGIVGRNGHGKSTLLKIITGEQDSDTGQILISDQYKIGYLTQHLRFTEESVLKETSLALPKNPDGWEETYKAESILMGLGFTEEQMNLSPQQLSGGYQIRLNLAKLLVSEPHLLLLDEPTNYLDIVSLRWLTRFLNNWPHELLLVTHDRGFMDAVTTHTLAIHRGKVRKRKGTTAQIYEQIETEEEIHQKTFLNQQKQIKKTEQFIRTFRAKATKAKAVQSKIKALDKLDKLEALEDIENLEFQFQYKPFSGKHLLEVSDLTFGYTPENILIDGLSFTVKKEDRIGVIGKNGKGKTTLLNLLAGDLHKLSGTMTYSRHSDLGYFGQTNVDRLRPHSTIEDEILDVQPDRNRTRARTICGAMMFSGDKALKKIEVLSGGEKSRVLLGKVLVTPANFLLLDEPTNHLDMYSHEALIEAIENFPGALMVVTHSEEMLHRVVNRLIVFEDDTVTLFEGTYADFLRRIGWKDEEEIRESDEQKEKNLSKKELRKQRAQAMQEKNKLIKPLEKKIAQIEKEIMEKETAVEEMTAELIEITKTGYGDDASKLSRTISEYKEQIDTLYDELESQSDELAALAE